MGDQTTLNSHAGHRRSQLDNPFPPVTIPTRRAAFETYAQTILDQRKDVVWTGGAVLDGIARCHTVATILWARQKAIFGRSGNGADVARLIAAHVLATQWNTAWE